MKRPNSREGVLIASLCLSAFFTWPWHTSGQGEPTLLVTISAASFERAPLAPEAIVAGFGAALATTSEAATTLPLPTTLAGRAVRVKDSANIERSASLFFVSPDQINYLIPANTALGMATVTVWNGNSQIAAGTVEIVRAAPGIFTVESSGQGFPVGYVQRAANGSVSTESVALPIRPANGTERVFLVLFLSGLRGAAREGADVLFGGQRVKPEYADFTPGSIGLDQINVELPEALTGRGSVDLSVSALGRTSNTVKVEIGGRGNTPPRVDDPASTPVLAGSSMLIKGAGFDPEHAKNIVRIGGVEAKVTEVPAPGQLAIRVPFGVASGPITVQTRQGEGRSEKPLVVRTSLSGFIEDTRGQPLAGIRVRVPLTGGDREVRSDAEGAFILPDLPQGERIIEFYADTLPYPPLYVASKQRIVPGRDNIFVPTPIAFQQTNGPSLTVGAAAAALRAAPAQQPSKQVISTEGIVFEVASNTRALFPDQTTRGKLTLTAVENSRTPLALPSGFFSSSVAQLSPFNVRLTPGAKLIFPNREQLPAGTPVKLFRIDQRTGSPTIGSFIEAGTAVVSADGNRIETAPEAVTDTSIYFVAAQRTTTTIVGRVVDHDGQTPVRLAHMRARGQEAFTDGNGGFVLRNILANVNDVIVVDASFKRPSGSIDRTQPLQLREPLLVIGGITDVGALPPLSEEGSNRPPLIDAPAIVEMNVNDPPRELLVTVRDPDPGQTVQASFVLPRFVEIVQNGPAIYILRLSPVKNAQHNDAGRHTLPITALDSKGASRRQEIIINVNQPPLANPQALAVEEDKPLPITLTGTDPDGGQPSFILVKNPGLGTLTGNPPTLLYTPKENLNGSDSFTFKTSDGIGESAETMVAITILPVNDDPTLITPSSRRLDTQTGLSFSVTASDVDGDRLTLTAVGLPSGATFPAVTGLGTITGQFNWVPSSAQFGGYSVTFHVTDGNLSVNRPVAITVTPRWDQTADKLTAGQIFALLPVSPGLLLAGTSGGIFRSVDNGVNWLAGSTGLTTLHTNVLAMSGLTLFAGTNGGGIFRSNDSGQSWSACNNGLAHLDVRALAVNGTELFAGTFGSGVFRSTNNCQSWNAVATTPTNFRVNALVVSGGNLFAGTEDHGLLRLSNTDWLPVACPSTAILKVRALAGSGTQLYAGVDAAGTRDASVFRFQNNGQNCQPLSTSPVNPTINALAISGTTLLAGTSGGGVFLLQNEQWAERKLGLDNPFVAALAVAEGNFFAGTAGGGVFRSGNQGAQWAASNMGLTTATINALAVTGAKMFAGTAGNGVFCSINDGRNWAKASEGLGGVFVNVFLLQQGKLYAGTNDGVFMTPLTAPNCAAWTNASEGLPLIRYVNALAASSTDLYLGANSGVFRFNHQTEKWDDAHLDIQDKDIRALAVSNNAVFAGTENGGVFRSSNRGQNWDAINTGLPRCTNLGGSIRVHALNASTEALFAGTCNGVYRFDEQTQSWQPVNLDLPPQAFVNTLFVHNNTLYAGLFGGIFLSVNYLDRDARTVRWLPANNGLAHINIYAFAASGPNLLAGTIAGGVYLSR